MLNLNLKRMSDDEIIKNAEIKLAYLQVVLMPNKEIVSMGKSLGFYKEGDNTEATMLFDELK